LGDRVDHVIVDGTIEIWDTFLNNQNQPNVRTSCFPRGLGARVIVPGMVRGCRKSRNTCNGKKVIRLGIVVIFVPTIPFCR
jgi:hypothetical protein